MKNILSALVLMIGLAFVQQCAAQTDTTLTYQGQLQQNGSPANGSFNLEFSIWTAPSGGSQVGSELTLNGISVVNGLFTVQLDFGGAAFDNDDRWLEIKVNNTALSPRQPISRTPYAIQTRGIFVNEDETFVGIGQVTPFYADGSEVFQLHRATGAGMTISSNGAPAYYAYADLNSGGHAFHYYDGPTGSWHLNNGNVNRLTVTSAGHIGIGTTDPGYPLHVWTAANDPTGPAIYAVNNAGGYAGWFTGNVDVAGNLSKTSGSFKIDHPLDPANQFLYHSFVESPDMMNIYNGNVVTDGKGYATVELPEWFEALNRDYRYQLTVLDDADTDEFVFAKVVQKIQLNSFTIRTSVPNTEVSWQVTGVRQDAWAEAHRIPVEEEKVGHERGHYLHPEVHGLDREMSIDAAQMALQESAQAESQSPTEIETNSIVNDKR